MIGKTLRSASSLIKRLSSEAAVRRPPPPPPRPRVDLHSASRFEPARGRAPVALEFRPQAQAPVATRAAVSSLREDFVDRAAEFALGFGASSFASSLSNDELSQAEKNELVRQVLTDENAVHALLGFQRSEPRNVNYDEAQAVATGIQEAWEAGAITEADLATLTENLSEEDAAHVALLLASDPANTQPGGVLEAFGEQAQAAGHEQAAALALTSSEALIEEHYPTDSAQREAFEQLEGYLEENERLGHNLDAGQFRAFYSLAASNAVRLSANGNGFSDSQLQSFVEELGPSLANEVLARSLQVAGDRDAGGAVEVLGRAFEAIAPGADGEDQRRWEVNAATAFTSSNVLIERNLNTPERREEAFTVLTEQLESLRDEAGEAAGEYSLLEYPAVLDGATRLFGEHGPELIDRAVQSSDPARAAELSAFLQDTLYSPTATTEARERVQRVLEGYAEDKLSAAGNDAVQVGQDVGRLLAIVQLSANAAVERAGSAGEAGSPFGDLARGVFASVAGKLAATLVGTVTANPLVGVAVSTATSSVLRNILGEEPDPERLAEQLEDHFREMLDGEGINTNFGEQFRRELNDLYAAVSRDLNDAIDSGNHTPAEREELREQAFELEQLYRSLNDAYEDYEDAEDIGRAIEDRDD